MYYLYCQTDTINRTMYYLYCQTVTINRTMYYLISSEQCTIYIVN